MLASRRWRRCWRRRPSSSTERCPGVVGIGSVVTVDETDNGAGARYRLVGSHEAQEPGDVSISSPVGQALLGRRASETVTVSLPDGRTRRLRIVSVAPPT